jgi:hypothetical protein
MNQNLITLRGNNNTVDVFGTLTGTNTAIFMGTFSGSQPTGNIVNLNPGSRIENPLAGAIFFDVIGARLTVNDAVVQNNHPFQAPIRLIGNLSGGRQNYDGIYQFSDAVVVALGNPFSSSLGSAALSLNPWSNSSGVRNNIFTFSGNTLLEGALAGINLTGGTGNFFDIAGNTIIRARNGSGIVTGVNYVGEGGSNVAQEADTNTFVFRGNAEVTGAQGAFLGRLDRGGRDILVLRGCLETRSI